MRPDILNPLFIEVSALDGVGPKMQKPLEKLGLRRVRDVAYHLPDRFVTRRAVGNLDEASVGEQVVVALTPTQHKGSSGRGPYRVLAQDEDRQYLFDHLFRACILYGQESCFLWARNAGSPGGSINMGKCFRSSIPIMWWPKAPIH